MDTIGIWIGAFLTLCIFSFLYKDNPFYKFAEHLFVGVSAGYWVARTWHNALVPNLFIPVKEYFKGLNPVTGKPLITLGDKFIILLYIIPGILGLLMLTRLISSIGWLSRFPISFIVGMTAGINIFSYLQSNGIAQIKGTILPLIVYSPQGTILWANSVNNIVLIFGVLCGLLYFFFSLEHKGAIGVFSKIGIWFLMVSFGASFGYTIMARISLLIGRMQFLLGDWLHLI